MTGTNSIRNASITNNLNDAILPSHTSLGADQDQVDVMPSKIQGGNESSHMNNDHNQYRSIINASYPRSSSPMISAAPVFHSSHYQPQGGMIMLPTMQSSSGDLNRAIISSLDSQGLISSPDIVRFPQTSSSGGLADQHQHHQDAFTQFPAGLMVNGRSMLSEDSSVHNSQSMYQFHPYSGNPTSYSSSHRYGYSFSPLPSGVAFPISPFHSPLALTDLNVSQSDSQYLKHFNDVECCSPSALMQTIPITDDPNQSNIASLRDQANQGWMMMYADTIDGQFYCRICPNSRLFNSKATLKKHIQYCHAEKPQCPYCKAGIRADNMSRHIKRYCPKAGYKNATLPVSHRGQQPRYSIDVLKSSGSSNLDIKSSETSNISSRGSEIYNQEAWNEHKRIDESNPILHPTITHENVDKIQSRKGSAASEDHNRDTSLATLSFIAADREKTPNEEIQNKNDQKQDSSLTLPSIRKSDIMKKDPSNIDTFSDIHSITDTSLSSRFAFSNPAAQNRQLADYYQQLRNTHRSNDSISFQSYPQNFAPDQVQFQHQNSSRNDPRSQQFIHHLSLTSHSDLIVSPMNLPPLFQLSISPNSSYDHQGAGLSSWTTNGPSQLSNVLTLGNVSGTLNRQSSNSNMDLEMHSSVPISYQQYISHPPAMPRYTMKPVMDFSQNLNQQNIEKQDQTNAVFEQRNMTRININNSASRD